MRAVVASKVRGGNRLPSPGNPLRIDPLWVGLQAREATPLRASCGTGHPHRSYRDAPKHPSTRHLRLNERHSGSVRTTCHGVLAVVEDVDVYIEIAPQPVDERGQRAAALAHDSAVLAVNKKLSGQCAVFISGGHLMAQELHGS